MKNRKTQFLYGFSFQGKRTTNVGEDLIGTYTAPDSWTMPTYEGTPVDFDTANPGDLKKTADGEAPDALLYTRINNQLTDLEWVTGAVVRDEVEAGNKATVVLVKKNGIIETDLLHDTSTPTAGDDVYVEGNMYSNGDPNGDGTGVVGKCLEVNDGVAKIILK